MTETAVVVATTPKDRAVQIEQALEERAVKLMEVMPEGMDARRFMRATLTAISRNPDILTCTPASIITAVFDAAEAGFVPTGSLNRAYLVPRNVKVSKKGQPNKYEKHAILEIGYEGYADLIRDGGATKVECRAVFEGDTFEVQYGTDPKIVHVPAFLTIDPVKMSHVYAVVTFPDGTTIFEVMTRDQVEAVRAMGQGGNSPAWTGSHTQMSRKTVIRRIAHYLQLSPRAQAVIAKDDERERLPALPAGESKTASVRAQLAAKLGKGSPPPSDEPEITEEPEIDAPSDAAEPQNDDAEGLFEDLDAAGSSV